MAADRSPTRTGNTAADRFRDLIEAAPDAILEVRKDGKILTANAQAERLFRYTREELLGKTVEDLLPPRYRGRHSTHRHDYANRPVLRPMGTGLDLYAMRSDGTEFAVDINLSPLTADDGQRVVCIIRDVSERKRAEEQIRTLNQNLAAANQALELRNKEVERVNQLKSEFLASMSHELRTPLNTIIGFSDLLAEQVEQLFNEKQKRFLSHIRGDAHHLLTLINDILDLSKIEAGRLELRAETFGLTSALEEVLSSLRPLVGQKRIQLENLVGGSDVLHADRVRFKEILYNLLSNAIKFTPADGRIWIDSIARDGQVEMTVGDTGIGIPVEEQAAIFESFHQVGFTTKGVREGTGLGLAITRRLVEQHGGRIWVESAPGEGSRFHFSMPLADLEDGASTDATV
ncbi:MAG: PAS domain-containing sensor histidine kinase, partial [Bryobacteraceae bacterium]